MKTISLLFCASCLLIAGCKTSSVCESKQDSQNDGFNITRTTRTNLLAGVYIDLERFHEGSNLVFETRCIRPIRSNRVVRTDKLFYNNMAVAEILHIAGSSPSIKTYGIQGIDVISSVDEKGTFVSLAVQTNNSHILAACIMKNDRLWPLSTQTLMKQNAFTCHLSEVFNKHIQKKDTPEDFLSTIETLKEESKELNQDP